LSSYVVRAETGPERERVTLTRRCDGPECRTEWRVERTSVSGSVVERVLAEGEPGEPT